MKNRLLKLISMSLISLFLLAGCSKNTPPITNNDPTDSKTEETNNNNNNNNTEKENTSNNEKAQNKFEEAITKIYTTDYTNESKAMDVEEYLKSNFTPEGAEEMINKIISYESPVKISDLLVTLVKEVDNDDSRFTKKYEIRYNITVTIDKPSVYSDLISVVFADKEGNIIIESLNQNNF